MSGEQGSRPGSEIRFEAVSKVYREAERPAVDRVTLTIPPGTFVVLLGPSGCGKTTLLKMVNRLIEPSSGHILLDGVDVQTVDAPALRRRIGYVIQQTGLFPHMRVADNVAVVPRLLRWDKRRIDDRVDELLDLVGLPHAEYRRRYPSQLSGGEQQRVGLARALAVGPSMMLMDEPFGALDAITRSRLQGEVLRLHRALGQTILFVTHDIDEAVRLGDVIVVMRDGRVVQHGTPLEIVTSPADAFVSDLVGGGDAIRRLGLIDVASVESRWGPAQRNGTPAVADDASLRQVLETMLGEGIDAVDIEQAEGNVVGSIDVETIWDVAGRREEG